MANYVVYQGPNGAVSVAGTENVSVSANYTVKALDYIVTATGAGNFTITLLSAVLYSGKNIIIKCLSTSQITVNAYAGEFIDTFSSKTLYNGEVLDITSDGTKWVDTIGSSISGAKIVDSTVTASKLASNSVTTDKIVDANVTTAKIADSNVTTAKIANDAVTAAKIATGAVGADEINTASQPTVNTIYTNNWFRSNGNTGWYNQTHGGGIWMEDSNYVKVYASKAFMPSSGSGTNGIIFPLDPGGGSGDGASIKYYAYSGEACRLDFIITNDADDYMRFVTPSGTMALSNRLTLSACGSRGTTGYAITTPNDSIANALRANGYIEWQTDVGAIGTNYFLSDVRKKENIQKTKELAINLFKKIEYISFDWKPESGNLGHVKVGMSAQQTQSIEASLVRELSDGSLMIHEPSIIPYLGKAIQEQQEQIQSLEERIKKLEELIKS